MAARTASASLLVVALALASSASGAPERTLLVLHPEGAGAPWAVRYSQAVFLTAALLAEPGVPVVGRRVSFFLEREGDEGTRFFIDDPVTGANGVATARLTVVNGRHGGQVFPAAAATAEVPGARYVVRASFLGDVDEEDCAGGDAGPAPDDAGPSGLCPARAEAMLFVAVETTVLRIEPGNEVALGGTVRLIATLTDANGDAEPGGTAVDGIAPKPLEGRSIGFFYDADQSGRPSLEELLGYGTTNSRGIATLDFYADPEFVRTSNVSDGIHAQFGGDAHYALSGASQALVVTPAPPDPERTLLEALPDELPADGFSELEVRATLVDAFNNLLGVDDEPYLVSFTTDLGTLEGGADRDPVTGRYVQKIRASRTAGTATVQIHIEGEPGATTSVTFTERGCTCGEIGIDAPLPLVALLALGVVVARRRRTRG